MASSSISFVLNVIVDYIIGFMFRILCIVYYRLGLGIMEIKARFNNDPVKRQTFKILKSHARTLSLNDQNRCWNVVCYTGDLKGYDLPIYSCC